MIHLIKEMNIDKFVFQGKVMSYYTDIFHRKEFNAFIKKLASEKSEINYLEFTDEFFKYIIENLIIYNENEEIKEQEKTFMKNIPNYAMMQISNVICKSFLMPEFFMIQTKELLEWEKEFNEIGTEFDVKN